MKIVILVIEDESEVRDAIARDLRPFEGRFRIELTADAEEAGEVLAEGAQLGERVGLVLADHLLPGVRGTDFLVDLNRDPAMAATRKVLITGQAGHDDTIRAINEAGLDYYIAKPWTQDGLHAVVRDQLTGYVLDNVEDVLPYVAVLDGPRLMEGISQRTWDE
jgi:two-component system chemotaxis response regulator CheY